MGREEGGQGRVGWRYTIACRNAGRKARVVHGPQCSKLAKKPLLAILPKADRYVAIKSAVIGAFGRSRKVCYATLESAWYEPGHSLALLVRLSTLNR
ncbi:hypothetical protein E2C01_061486 [Portunus trituberculatus]|uniref:Uncharacterized protein n=1 Tax=Portunus trituberculatus TaxID=210409 RepID=A0A5B7HF59_PORTR|nr:hypothetical protein [Portunus trituberculatus]